MKSVSTVAALVMVVMLVMTSPVAAVVGNPILQHDYFAASGLTDLSGNGRDAVLGANSTLVSGSPGYVSLPGGSGGYGVNPGSGINFPSDVGGQSLSSLQNGERDATIEVWLELDPSTPLSESFNEGVFRWFNLATDDGSRLDGQFDQRQENDTGGAGNRLGVGKDSDIVNGSWLGGDASRARTQGLHQWVFTFDGDAPNNTGTWSGYRDASPILNEDGTSTHGNVYLSNLGPILAAAGGGDFWVGGKHPARNGASPIGKLYRVVIYGDDLSPSEVALNYQNGLANGLPEPATLSLLAVAGLGLLRRRRHA